MDRIFRPGCVQALARVEQVESRLETERQGDRCVRLEAGRSTVLDSVDRSKGHAGADRKVTQRPRSSVSRISDGDPDVSCEAPRHINGG
jgi:hypothetical protein